MTRLRPAPGVGSVDGGDTVYAALLPDGPIMVLDGVAALIWVEACAGERATIVDRVAAATDATSHEIRAEIERFVADLVARGLLVSHDA
jgi:hypothetical protein